METRLANESDLPKLKIMFDASVENMNKNGITIWSKVFPYEELPHDIKNKNLRLILDGEEIIATFGLFGEFDGQDCFAWQDKNSNAFYLGRVNVNVKYLRQGFGRIILDQAATLARKSGADFLRLTVGEINKPAINLYAGYGFTEVAGKYKEFSPSLDADIILIGMELPL